MFIIIIIEYDAIAKTINKTVYTLHEEHKNI